MARSLSAASSQYILTNSAPSINFGSDNFTVLAWVRFPTIPTDESMIIGKRAGGFDGDAGFELKFNDADNGEVRFDVQTDTTGNRRAEASRAALVDGNWHLLGGDRNNVSPQQIRIWFDGSVIDTDNNHTDGSVSTTTPLVIGAAYDTPSLTNYLTGQIGPVMICRRILSAAEHAYLAKGFSFQFLKPYPCFYLPMISRAGGNEPDIVGGLNAGLGNSPGIVPNPRIIYPNAVYLGQDFRLEFAAATINAQSNVIATAFRKVGTANVTIAGQSSLTADLTARVAPKATIAAQSSVSAQANITASVGANISAQSGMSASLSAKVPVSTGISAQSALTALISPRVGVAAQIDGQSAVSATGDRIRTLSTALAGQSALSSAATIKAGASVQLDGRSGLTAFLSSNAPIATVVSAQSNVSARVTALTPASATIAGQSALTATVTRARAAAATIAGQSALTASGNLLAAFGASIAAQSGLTATVKARVPVAATVAGQSALAVLPSFPGERKTITVGGYIRWLEKAGGQPI